MDIGNLIKSRRSTYTSQFSGEKIDDQIIWELLENANWAPSHFQTEPWRFKVYTQEGLRRLLNTLAEAYKHTSGDKFSSAKYQKYETRNDQVSHALVVILNKSNKVNLPEIEEIEAVACAMQNLWLTVASKPEICGYWSTGPLVYKPEFAAFLDLESNQQCLGIFYLGKPKENAIEMKKQRSPIAEKVTWINN